MLGENCSIYIVHRNAHADRLENLNTVLEYYHSILPNLEIIVVEEDSKSNLKNMPPWVTYVFAYNPGIFNSAWGYNVAAKISKKPIGIAICNDTIIKYSTFIQAENEILTYHWGCYIPYSMVCHLDIFQTKAFRESFRLPDIKYVNRKIWEQLGGVVFFDKKVFFELGGYNEDFRGWAPEDAEFAVKNNKVGMMKRNKNIEHNLYHLFHYRFETVHGKNTKENMEGEILGNRIKGYSLEQMRKHIEVLKGRDIGNPLKFHNLKKN